MDHHRVRALPGSGEAVEVLVVVEGVSSAPVDQAQVRQGQALTVVVDGRARFQQGVGDPGDRTRGIVATDGRPGATPVASIVA
jgi:hypothetical protein